jgi:hypothetical protein
MVPVVANPANCDIENTFDLYEEPAVKGCFGVV